MVYDSGSCCDVLPTLGSGQRRSGASGGPEEGKRSASGGPGAGGETFVTTERARQKGRCKVSSTQWLVDPNQDQGFFDGSTEPNPGGVLGIGWHMVLRDGATHEGSLQEPRHPGNTNNVAE